MAGWELSRLFSEHPTRPLNPFMELLGILTKKRNHREASGTSSIFYWKYEMALDKFYIAQIRLFRKRSIYSAGGLPEAKK
jgi:hypothetical protein